MHSAIVNRVVRRADFNRKIKSEAWTAIGPETNGIVRVRVNRTGNAITIQIKE